MSATGKIGHVIKSFDNEASEELEKEIFEFFYQHHPMFPVFTRVRERFTQREDSFKVKLEILEILLKSSLHKTNRLIQIADVKQIGVQRRIRHLESNKICQEIMAKCEDICKNKLFMSVIQNEKPKSASAIFGNKNYYCSNVEFAF